MKKPTLEMRVLQRGVELLGSEHALARYLRVPMPELLTWLKGTDEPPRLVFFAAVDLLVDRGDVHEPNSAPRQQNPAANQARASATGEKKVG